MSRFKNTKVFSIVKKLEEYQCDLSIADVFASKREAKQKYDIDIISLSKIKNQDAIILAVGHRPYTKFTKRDWSVMLRDGGVLIGCWSIYSKLIFEDSKIIYWSL